MIIPNYLYEYSHKMRPHPIRDVMAKYTVAEHRKAKMVPRSIIMRIPRAPFLYIKSTTTLTYVN